MKTDLITFQYHSDVLAQYPNIRGGVILGHGLHNGPTPEALGQAYQDEQQAVIAQIGETPLSEIETLAAWRSALRKFGVNPTKYRSAPEALLRRLTKKGDIPSINTLVDLGNLVSIRYGLPVAIFDTGALQGPITVHLADGSERFTPLFETEVQHPEAGEVVFSDETGLVVARRWCWRQSNESAAREETSQVVIVTEAQHTGGEGDIQAALEDLRVLVREYAGGEIVSGILSPENPAITG